MGDAERIEGGSHFDTGAKIDGIRARLYDVARDLRPVPTVGTLVERIRQVQGELHRIEQELQMVVHLTTIEDEGLDTDLERLAERIEGGWVPDSRPVEEVVAELRAGLA